jgi:hypothetical protein
VPQHESTIQPAELPDDSALEPAQTSRQPPEDVAPMPTETVRHPARRSGILVATDAPTGAPTDPERPDFVYALGQIEPRSPSLGLEKEIAQVIGRGGSEGLTSRQALQAVISERSNRYLARQLCWVFLIEGLETYILLPNDPADYDLLVDAVRGEPRRDDVDVVIGRRGPIAPANVCGGLSLPMVAVDHLYTFDRDSLIQSVPRPETAPQEEEEQFRSAVGELFDRIMQMADNAGATDEHRALNYLAVRYPMIYAIAAEAHKRNAGLSEVEVRPSRLSGARKIVDVIFSHTHRQTDVLDKHFVRVDVSEEFPFLVTKLSPFYDR